MRFILNPQPHMEDQRFFPARSIVASIPYVGMIAKVWIDPTCARYCLKSLLIWHKNISTGVQNASVAIGFRRGEIPKMNDETGPFGLAYQYFLYLAANYIAYDPVVNYPDAERLLRQATKPSTISGWQKILYSNGPIILSGVLGAASVPHAILLIGVDYDPPGKFYFLDPLSGNELKEELFSSMQTRIDDEIVYGKKGIQTLGF